MCWSIRGLARSLAPMPKRPRKEAQRTSFLLQALSACGPFFLPTLRLYAVEVVSRLFQIAQSVLQPCHPSLRKMTVHAAPVLYSVDLSECAAIRQLTTARGERNVVVF